MPPREPERPPKGPWSDLPPPTRPKRERLFNWPARSPRSGREPWIRNWKGLAIVAFLLFVAPFLARWASQLILGLMNGG